MTESEGPPFTDYLRRLREFQIQVRERTRPYPSFEASTAVPARGPLSAPDAAVLERLNTLSPPLAQSLEQSLRDLNDVSRLSYVGPAGEVREVMRAAIQMLAPDDEIRAQTWFKGHAQGDKFNPTQTERTRLAVQKARGNPDQLRDLDTLIDELVGKIARETYATGSRAFHTGTARDNVWKLTRWVFAVLGEVLPG